MLFGEGYLGQVSFKTRFNTRIMLFLPFKTTCYIFILIIFIYLTFFSKGWTIHLGQTNPRARSRLVFLWLLHCQFPVWSPGWEVWTEMATLHSLQYGDCLHTTDPVSCSNQSLSIDCPQDPDRYWISKLQLSLSRSLSLSLCVCVCVCVWRNNTDIAMRHPVGTCKYIHTDEHTHTHAHTHTYIHTLVLL